MTHKMHGKNNDWYLSTPVTNTLQVDGNRTDSYIEDGSPTKPFKTIQAALDKFETEITTDNFYMMRIVNLIPCIYNENIIVPPSRLTIYSSQAIINGSVTIRRNDTIQSTAIDPLTGTHTNRMWYNFRLDGGATRESMNADGGIMITGNIICSHSSDVGNSNIDIYATNASIGGGITPNNDFDNPTTCSGKINIYLTDCVVVGNVHTSVLTGSSGQITIGMSDCRMDGSFIKNPNATSVLDSGRIRFEKITDTSIYGVDLPYGEFKTFTASRVCLSNVRFNVGTVALTAASAVTLKLDAHTYKTLLVEHSPIVTNVNFELIDIAAGIANDSLITGDTVKDALNNLVEKNGINGTFTTVDGKTITVVDGQISSIV